MRPGPSDWPAPGQLNCGGTTQPACKNGTNPGRTHRFYTGNPSVTFGFGLSYASFSYRVPPPPPPPPAISTPRNCYWGPRNIYCCKSLWIIFCGPR